MYIYVYHYVRSLVVYVDVSDSGSVPMWICCLRMIFHTEIYVYTYTYV